MFLEGGKHSRQTPYPTACRFALSKVWDISSRSKLVLYLDSGKRDLTVIIQ